jgi:hypothetical protein
MGTGTPTLGRCLMVSAQRPPDWDSKLHGGTAIGNVPENSVLGGW